MKIMWLIFAILSSVFAALTSILAKIGIDGVNSNLATEIRTAVVLALSWLMVFATGAQSGISEINKRNWIYDGHFPPLAIDAFIKLILIFTY